MVTVGKLCGLKLAGLITYLLFLQSCIYNVCKNTKDVHCWFALTMELKMALLRGCNVSFVLTMHHSQVSMLTGMEVPPEIRGLKTGGLISESQWEVGGSTF